MIRRGSPRTTTSWVLGSSRNGAALGNEAISSSVCCMRSATWARAAGLLCATYKSRASRSSAASFVHRTGIYGPTRGRALQESNEYVYQKRSVAAERGGALLQHVARPTCAVLRNPQHALRILPQVLSASPRARSLLPSQL